MRGGCDGTCVVDVMVRACVVETVETGCSTVVVVVVVEFTLHGDVDPQWIL